MTTRRTLLVGSAAAATATLMPGWRAPALARTPGGTPVPSVTFVVDGVKAGTVAMKTVPVKDGLSALLNTPTFESWSTRTPTLVEVPKHATSIHPFLLAVSTAYHAHYPLVLSPDMIWLVLLQGVASHVTANPEKVRKQFVAHEGKLVLHLRRDGFALGNPENDWEGVFSEFSGTIRTHIGPATHDLIAARFSTTGIVEQAAMDIALMDAMQSYFVFTMSTACGFPAVTLEGTPDDWQALRTRAAGLQKLDLDWWIPHVLPILDQFVASSRGSADREFWCNFYKLQGVGSGTPRIQGHIVNLFPYFGFAKVTPERLLADYVRFVRSGADGRTRSEAEIIADVVKFKADLATVRAAKPPHKNVAAGDDGLRRNPYIGKTPMARGEGMTTESVKTRMNTAPVVWEYLGKPLQMEFLAGFMGATQDPATLAIRPAIGWAVRRGVG